jgi:hypothetical protein
VHVVDDMQVVVQEQQRQGAAIFDDDGAGAGGLMRAVFEIGADLQQACPIQAASR